ncbi:hypothetical protein ab3b_01995 [Weissella cibaria]|uniref:Uncharacterized protein n=1 Tax=Weissella cibaria TaxID=137591 RepID=A0A0D1JIW3_9LACO|nr:hypothetical protein ab3b_01995 [Weissella cibaria]
MLGDKVLNGMNVPERKSKQKFTTTEILIIVST